LKFIDPAPAIARRVVDLLGTAGAAGDRLPSRFIFTSGRAPQPVLRAALAGFGLAEPTAAGV
jgi:glutamate racemase